MVFVDYADNNSGDCYCMWNPSTSKVTESCDVIWLIKCIINIILVMMWPCYLKFMWKCMSYLMMMFQLSENEKNDNAVQTLGGDPV